MAAAKPASPILCVDIGGSHVKAALAEADGTLTGSPLRVKTPRDLTPDRLIGLIAELAAEAGSFARVAVGFPGAVRDGVILTAPNLGDGSWKRVPFAAPLAERLGAPVRLANDGTVQGLGAIGGHGLECVITLGTGMGFALFHDGQPAPHLELGQHPAWKKLTYDRFVGEAALEEIGRKHWRKRVDRVIAQLRVLTGFDHLYVGGGNARLLTDSLAKDVTTVANEDGLTGGARLWALAVAPAG
ncbi:MAG: ROK family protein [Acetobacteraceae bacterium]